MSVLFDLFGFFLMSLVVAAAGPLCSIHPPPDTPASVLPSLAKVSQADAQHTARARLKAPSAEIVSGELEIENGCLVYSFDIRTVGKWGVDEIMVDAGTGKILSHKHESPRQEAAEQAKDKASSKKP